MLDFGGDEKHLCAFSKNTNTFIPKTLKDFRRTALRNYTLTFIIIIFSKDDFRESGSGTWVTMHVSGGRIC